ncbi:Alpha/Beta hydrolase protein [Gilbertella persicaria]|uniref:Alpha/Beta hydrolase protein n=1 Tax=Gilbertella persicaria TaxID=101096 RepID=UPI00221E97B5|nr:Alpha/Beta hydrolase protein [Gilbertella persicaria]KAI8061855.1 Alpha/Beta hydrolase protein [Gilbertella persicaria]
MFQLVTALVATGYIFSVIAFSFAIVCAFGIPAVRQFLSVYLRRHVMLAEILSSVAVEFSFQAIVFKLMLIQVVKWLGGFNYTLAWLFYFIDMMNMGGLAVLFYEMLKEITVADDAIKAMDNKSQPIKSIIGSVEFMKLVNPFWTPAGIRKHPNITYATNEEIQDALATTNHDFDQPRKMMLDVYTFGEKSTGLKPVMVHIHGGAWRIGSKNTLYPHEKILLTENNWVVVNIGYRLAPKNAYPTHLCDVKRAIRWIKQNIASFGGNPHFIVLSGDSAGGHLSAMASMTMNDPQFQPGFEHVDTSVKGVVSLSGALDISAPHLAEFFCKQVANLDKVDMDFMSKHSPAQFAQTAKDQGKLVPFLAGHHVSYMTWSPRSLYMSRVIQTWVTQLYLNLNKSKLE